MMTRSYSELSNIQSYKERYLYLQIHNSVADETFYGSRYLNQKLYSSKEWKDFRTRVIVRDNGCDMGMPDDAYQIHGDIYIHHLNPLTKEQILNRDKCIFDLDNAVCVSFKTHQAIHYGSFESIEPKLERSMNDTCPWRR